MPQPTLEDLLANLGPEPTDPISGPAPATYQGSNLLESMAGLENQNLPAPRGFGESLLQGFAGGIGRAGTRASMARQRFEQGNSQRQMLRDQDNLARSREYRQRKFELTKDFTERAGKAPVLTPEQEEQKIEREAAARARGTASVPERPNPRAEAAAARAEASEQRKITQQERTNAISMSNSIESLRQHRQNDPVVKGYEGVRSNLKTAEAGAGEKSGPGDIAIVFSFMRAMEPENVNSVREGEYDNARSATGLLERYKNLPDRYFAGNQLTDVGRGYFLSAMRAALKSRRSDYEGANDQYRRSATAFGGDPTLFIRDYPEEPAPQVQFKPGGFFDKNRRKR